MTIRLNYISSYNSNYKILVLSFPGKKNILKVARNYQQTRFISLKSDIIITQPLIDIIIGNILGDGHIKFLGNNKCFIAYGYANEEYSNFILKKFKEVNITKYDTVYKSENIDKRYGNKLRTSYLFNTISYTEIFDFAKYFLEPYIIDNNNYIKLSINLEEITYSLIKDKNIKFKKVLPSYEIMFELLTPRALAF